MKKILFAIVFVLFAAVGTRAYWAYNQTVTTGGPRGGLTVVVPQPSIPADENSVLPAPNTVAPTTATTDVSGDSLQLSIATKKTYQVNEYMTGIKYQATYQGPAFDAVVLYKQSYVIAPISNADSNVSVGVKGSMNTYDLDFRTINAGGFITSTPASTPLSGSGITVNGKKTPISSLNIFQNEGTYVFTMSVYKCSDIVPGGKCTADNVSAENVVKLTPLKTVSETVTVKGKLVVPVKQGQTVLSCFGSTDPLCLSKFMDLFKDNLLSCRPSEGTTPIGLEVLAGLYRNYKIVGIQNNLCVVNFSLLAAPGADPTFQALVGQSMTCKYQDSKRTIPSVASTDNCAGPLYDSLQKLKTASK